MAFCVDRDVQARSLKNDSVLLLYCVRREYIDIPMSDLTTLTIRLQICHISIPNEGGVRRYAAMPERGLFSANATDTESDDETSVEKRSSDGIHFRNPKVIQVLSSCEVEWDDDGEKCGMVCIWKWKVLTTLPMNIQARQPTLPKPVLDDHLPQVLRSECQNCFPRPKAKVQGPPPQAAATPGQGPPPHSAATPSQGPPPHAAVTSGQGPPPQAAATPDQGPQPQTAATPGQGPPTAGPPAPQRNTTTQQEDEEIFHVMGSWKDDENNYLVTLQKVEKLMEAGENVPVRVRFDSKNKEDINAIAVDAFVDNSWCIVGDIKKHEIPKLTKAMRHDKVIACEFPSKPKYKINIMNSGCNGLMVNVRITRRGKWGKDNDEYRYNKDLTNLEKY